MNKILYVWRLYSGANLSLSLNLRVPLFPFYGFDLVATVFVVFGRTGLHAAAEGLLQIAGLTEGLSGRALRKLPFQAHAFYVQVRKRSACINSVPCAILWKVDMCMIVLLMVQHPFSALVRDGTEDFHEVNAAVRSLCPIDEGVVTTTLRHQQGSYKIVTTKCCPG